MKYTFSFISLSSSKDFEIGFTGDKNSFDTLISDIKTAIFSTNEVEDGKCFIVRVDDTIIENFLRLAKKTNHPKFNAVASWFKVVGADNYCAILNNTHLSQEETIALSAKLREIQEDIPYAETMSEVAKMGNDILKNYHIYSYIVDHRVDIGPKDKSLRVCRYCGRMQTDGATFKKVGHTISEGLGNKNIITNDECDECNEFFGQTVEPDFIRYIDALRAIFGIQAKGHKVVKSKGKNYVLETDLSNGKSLNIKVQQDSVVEKDGTLISYKLEGNADIIPQYLYKALVKYALGILPSDLMKSFHKTVKWLLDKDVYIKLPLVRTALNNGYYPEPHVTVYFRTSSDGSLPYAIGELHVLNMIFVYIIPTFSEDEDKFSNQEGWERVLDIFQIWKCLNWKWRDFSSRNKIRPALKINMAQRN